MSKRILIFRTDRVGDLIVSCPAILAIKKHFIDCNITLIASVKNFEYAKSLNIFSEVIIFPQENLIKKIKFISNLSKINFDYIFIFDGKDRSFLTSFFIKSRVKTGLATNIKKYHDFLKIKIFEFNNDNKLFDAMENLLIYSGITTKISDFSFISRKKDNNFSNNISINNYLHIHLDEKWFSELYINSYANIEPGYKDFTNFLNTLSSSNNILITTGLVNFNLLNDLKNNFFSKISDKIYFKKNLDKYIYFIYKPTFEDIESLMKKSKDLIVCHGSLTHVANHFNIKIIDIIEENKKAFYESYTHYLKNYNFLFRKNFISLKNDLVNLSRE